MKRVLSWFCIVCMIFSFTSCKGGGILGGKPESVCSNFLNAAIKNDYGNIEKCSNNSDAFIVTPPNMPGVNKDELKEVISSYNNRILKGFNYEIVSTVKSKDTAVVTIKTNNLDFGYAYKNAMADTAGYILNAYWSKEEISEEEILFKVKEIFNEEISGIQKNNKTVSRTVDVNLIKTDSGWKVEIDDALMDAVYGGMYSANKDMETSFKKLFKKVK